MKKKTFWLHKTLRINLYILGFICFHYQQSNAQDFNNKTCGIEAQMKQLYKTNPNSVQERNQLVKKLHTKNSVKKTNTTSSYTLPVVFHVFGTTFNEGSTVTIDLIEEALQKTNEDFKGLSPDYSTIDAPFAAVKQSLDITFKLAQLDPNGNPTTGVIFYEEASGMGNYNSSIVREAAWNNLKYINVYITRDLYDDGDYYNSGVAWYPDTFMTNQNIARIVYNGSYLASNTNENFRSVLTHEFGHFLDLPHTFEGGCSTNPSAGDGIDDTPSLTSSSKETNCNKIYNCYSQEINNENFMDYTDCYKMFTQGQVSRMTNALNNSTARNTLWTPQNLIGTGINQDLVPKIVASNTIFNERRHNDGRIDTTIDLTCHDCTFAKTSGNLSDGVDYTIANLPNGLTGKIVALNTTTARVYIEGSASNHASSNSIKNLKINFLNPMITGGVSQLHTAILTNLTINYRDNFIGYCTPNISNSNNTYISNMIFDENENPTNSTAISDYSKTKIFSIKRGNTYPISITTNKGNGNTRDKLRIQIWFDWNGNLIYENEELELTKSYPNTLTNTNGEYTFTSSIAIPTTAKIGTTAFRVIAHYKDYVGGGDTPCNTVDSGESEDYGLTILSSELSTDAENSLNAQLYPNPANKELFLKLISNEAVSLEIFNAFGKNVLKKTYKIHNSAVRLLVDKLNDGVYFVIGEQGNKRFTKKFVVKK